MDSDRSKRYKIDEAAECLGVSPLTLRREIKRGNINCYRPGQGRYLFSAKDLTDYEARHRICVQEQTQAA